MTGDDAWPNFEEKVRRLKAILRSLRKERAASPEAAEAEAELVTRLENTLSNFAWEIIEMFPELGLCCLPDEPPAIIASLGGTRH